MKKNTKIFLAGHKGLLGSSIFRLLKAQGYKNILTIEKDKLNLSHKEKTFNFFKVHKPEVVILAAAKVGGIYANSTSPANFIYENLEIQNNVIKSAQINNVKNLIFFGSSCIYPKFSKQPIKEKYLLSGALEPTNQAYAIAKIAGVELCQSFNKQYSTNYKCLMPTNTFGPNDNYNLKTSHFFPAMLRKFEEARLNKNKIVEIWGSGKPRREIIFVDDIADACLYFLKKKTKETLINIGRGKDNTIANYAKILRDIIYPDCKIRFNKKMPDGTPRKLLDVSLAKKYGWVSKANLKDAILLTINEFRKSKIQ